MPEAMEREKEIQSSNGLTIQCTIKQNKNEDDIRVMLEHPRMAGVNKTLG